MYNWSRLYGAVFSWFLQYYAAWSIGLAWILNHFFIQSDVNPKPIVTRSHVFSRALCQLHVCTSRFDWFIGLPVSRHLWCPRWLIWLSNWKPLSCRVFSALGSGSNGLGSSPGRNIVLCFWSRRFTLTVPLYTQVFKWINLTLVVNGRWTSIPSGGGGG